jgi:peptide/nickel transport system permease protein
MTGMPLTTTSADDPVVIDLLAPGVAHEAASAAPRRRRRRRRHVRISTKIAGAVVLLIALMAAFAPLLAPYAPNAGNTSNRLLSFGTQGHLLGTDGQGRDQLSRLMYGARLSLLAGLIPVAFAGITGTVLGLVAGLGNRRVHTAIMRTLDVFYAFPAVLLAIAIAAALGSGISNAIIALAVILVPPIARVAESETVQIKEADFMQSARSSGAGRLAIASAAGLSFLGLGVAPPSAEWGLMVSEMRQFLFSHPALAIVPAVAILIASVAFNVLGDGLRDWLDVRSEVVL